jgi:hypothetical protein
MTFKMPAYNVSVECAFAFKQYTVSFETNGASPLPAAIEHVDHGTTIAKSTEVSVLAGKSFKYWSQDGSAEFDFEHTAITSDITLKAVWENKKVEQKKDVTAVESPLLADSFLRSNPFAGVLELVNVEHARLVEVYILTGQLLVSQKMNGERELHLDAASWPTGVYIVKLLDATGQQQVLKAMKQ